ncbi:MAG: metallophosphoesterase [Deltaproteobacteria bacterium]|nr:metallophosphoesterase [Deltaproteobacteria bacterium]
MRLAALGDIHWGKSFHGNLRPLFSQIVDKADVLLLCGDLVHTGLPDEAAMFAKQMAGVRIPIISVLGNHEFESGKVDEVQRILSDAGAIVLDGDTFEFNGVGFAGVKGFAGGFGERALQPWGEETIKHFVHETVNEALKLESALAKLRTPHRIALLHYAPIQATVMGEPPEIYPFLGSSRLEEPLNRFSVTAVFHGHAHHGTVEGRTQTGIPVYNVAMGLLERSFPNQPPFRLVEIPAGNESRTETHALAAE